MRSLRFTHIALLSLILSYSPSLFLSFSVAHPVPKQTYDRTLTVRLTPEAAEVAYHLELDGSTAAEDLRHVVNGDELAELTTRQKVYAAFSRLYGPIFAGNLAATLDGKELEFVCVKHSHQEKDSLHCDFVFRALWKLGPGALHEFALQERNYLTNAGLINVSLLSVPPVTVLKKDEADEALKKRPPIEWRPGDEKRLRSVKTTFEVRPGETQAKAVPTAEPSPALLTETKPRTLLELLLSSDLGLWSLLGLAAVFGAVHALTPGHGKTLVAAYLVGERGTVWHAVLLGLVTTLTHTGAVLILAAVLVLYYPDTVPAHVQTALGFVGGILVAGLGVWLLLRRLAGGPDHIHIGGHGHHHHHDGHHHHHHDAPPPNWWGMIVVGIQGGIVPCWDAIAMFGFAIAAQRVWLGLPLLLAFSAGLAGVLVLIGVMVVKARGFAGSHWGESRLFRALPLVSAVLIMVLGLWLCYDSLHPNAPAPVSVSRTL